MQKTLGSNGYYSTTDLALAAALQHEAFVLEGVDRTNPSKALFIFQKNNHLEDMVQVFWSHSLRVEPLTYFNCLKEIKTRLYQATDD